MITYRHLVLGLVLLLSAKVSAQFCTTDDRFSEVAIFTDSQIESMPNVVYGNALSWDGVPEDLVMDIYYPNTTTDPLDSRPFIMLIHGGSFVGGDKSAFEFECNELAKRGYVVATMNYRLGFNPANPLNIINAIYRAQQDTNAAMRYMVDIAPTLNIDPNWLFIGGSSAGSITSFFTAYTSQAEWNSFSPGIEAALGALDSSGNSLPNSFEVSGIFNQWGAAFGDSVTPEELLPTISFHGALDAVVPAGSGPFGLIGSQLINDLLLDNSVCSDFTLDPTGGHGVYTSLAGRTFMLNRGSCFFKSIFCDACSNFFDTEPVEATCAKVLNITESNLPSNLSVYPNPFTSSISFSNLNGSEYFYLYTISGQLIYKGNDLQSKNLSQLGNGLYILKVLENDKQQIIKLVKQ